ncbi:MAG: hypothetical protein OXC56_02080 [Chloroflexi bacterium]|nr:hypothetical protein [Chloroflexota bacterium]
MNFVLLDLEDRDDEALAASLGLAGHPNFGTLKPNSDELVEGYYTAPPSGALRGMIERVLDEYGGG